MTDPIRAAIYKVDKLLEALVDYTDLAYDPGVEPLRAAIARLAALVREYGHKARCLCHGWAEAYAGSDDCDWRFGGNTPCGFKHKGEMYRDPRCLPESREVKP